MALHLVTGPANAAKAGAVLGPLRERLHEEPVLVVPSFEDVEHSQRELAERGAMFGARVLRFKWLYELIAERAGYVARAASDLQRRLIVEQSIKDADLQVMAASADRPGFARAAERFVTELESSMVEAPRFIRAMRDWAGDGPRRRYADEVGEVYRRYREGLDAAGLVDADLFAWRALEALGSEPERWGATPVFFYGFDDFTPLEREALRVLADRAEADVTVSLPYEPGREAFKATASLREELVAMGAEVTHLEAVSDHYAEGSRPALHALERGLFETVGGEADPGDAVRVHVAGGERAELELCGAEVLALLRQGTAPGDIAVVMRDPERYGSLVEQVFGAYGIPYSIDRSLPLAHTGLGRGLLALLRSAGPDGTAEDLLAYLRTPGPSARAASRRPPGGRRAPGRRGGGEGRARAVGEAPLAAGRARRDRRRRGRKAAGGAARAAAEAVRGPVQAEGARAPGRGARRRSRLPRGRGRAHGDDRGGGRRQARASGRRSHPCHSRRAAGAGRGEPPARPRAGGRPRRRARTPLRGGVRVRPAGARVPAPLGARRLPPGHRPRGAGKGVGPAAAAARGLPGPRALPLLRLRVARRAASGAQLALLRRGGQPRVAVVLPGGRPCGLRRWAGGRGAPPLAGRRHLVAGAGADRRGVGARGGAPGSAPCARAGGLDQHSRGAVGARRPRRGLGGRSGGLRGLPGQVVGGEGPAPRRAGARPRADGARRIRAQRARGDAEGPGGGDGLHGDHAPEPRPGRGVHAGRVDRAPRRVPPLAKPGAGARGGARAWSSISCATCATRPSARARSRRRTWSWSSASTIPTTHRCGSPTAPRCAAGSTGSTPATATPW